MAAPRTRRDASDSELIPDAQLAATSKGIRFYFYL